VVVHVVGMGVPMARGEYYNLTMTQGERFYLRVESLDPTTGAKQSYVGYTAVLKVATGWNGTQVLSIAGTVDTTGVVFAMSESLTPTYPAGNYVFDIFANGPDGPLPLLRGPFVLQPSAVGGAV
jgi:hypothetical protein